MQLQTYNLNDFQIVLQEHFTSHSLLDLQAVSDWEIAPRLVRQYGYNSTSYFTLSEDKQIFVASNKAAFISYREQGGCLLVLGDPIGPDSALPLVLEEFLLFSQRERKTVAFWQVCERLLPLYEMYGLHAYKLGEDAIIDVRHFSAKGGKMANVRTSARRAEKDHLRIIFYQNNITDANHCKQMQAISQSWLKRKGRAEMGFSMGRFTDHEAMHQMIAVAVDQEEHVHAFITLTPIYGRKGWALDLLRRTQTAAPGAIELLLVRAIEYLQAQGSEVLSLGLAPLSNYNQDSLSFFQRQGQKLLRRAKSFRCYQSLGFFKKKFHPTWENRYLMYMRSRDLPRVAYGLWQAHHSKA